MKYINALTMFLGFALLSSCIKHEIIPKPRYEAALPVSFTGLIQGAKYEIIEDFKGFYCKPSQAKEILPSPQPSKIVYYSALQSEDYQDMIQIRIGKLTFSSNNSATPSVEEFNDFFKNGITMPIEYTDGANDGVEIIFKDSQGKVWTSDEDSGLPQDFEFTKLVPDSDDDGAYMKFIAKFNVSLYDNPVDPSLINTLEIKNAIFEGYLKR